MYPLFGEALIPVDIYIKGSFKFVEKNPLSVPD